MEKTSLKVICLFCCFLLSFAIKAQNIQDINGRPMFEYQYTDVQGSPYFSESWIRGSVKMENGKTYADVELKYDMVTDELLFKNAKGEMLRFVDPVREFRLLPADGLHAEALFFKSGYKPSSDASANAFYQILTNGQTRLAKRLTKKVLENQPYSSATIIKTFELVPIYYVIKDGLPVKIRKDKKAMLAALGDYSEELAEFIRAKKLDLKSETDLIALMNYYNSLK